MTKSICIRDNHHSLEAERAEKEISRSKQWIYYIVFFPFLMYSYNISLQDYWSAAIQLLAFVICTGILFLLSLKNFWAAPAVSLVWFLILIIMLSNNYYLKYGHWSIVYSTVFPILLVFLLQISEGWFEAANVLMLIFTGEHIFFTWLFYFIPNFYYNHIISLFSSVSQQSLINQFKEGCVAGFTAHYSTNGMYLAIGSLLVFCLLFKENFFKYHKKGWAFLLMVTVGALLLTGKRGPFLFAVAAAMITYWVFNKESMKSIIKILVFLIAMAFMFGILINFIPALGNIVNRFLDQGGSDITNGRTGLYQFAWGVFLQNFWFGIGWMGYSYEFEKSSFFWGRMVGTHNVYLQLLCETGIVGTFIILAVIFFTLRLTFKSLNLSRKGRIVLSGTNEYYLAVSLAIQLFFIGYSITGNPLYDVQVFYPYIFACGISYAVRFKQVKKVKDGGA